MSLREQIQRRPVAAKPEIFDAPVTPRGTPYQRVGVNGLVIGQSGTFSSATPFLWITYGGSLTAEWKAAGPDYTTGFPPDTIVLDGSLPNCPSEYWVMR